jgi:pyridoxal phosphate enzyme (YggS family)
MIEENLIQVKKSIPYNVHLIAVSKTKPVSLIREAYNTGHLDFGENKVQELVNKQAELPKDIRWHMIGHLQSNKVKYIAPFIHMIHGVESFKLLKEINKHGKKHNRVIKCLLQFHIAQETTKFGLSYQDAIAILEDKLYPELQNISICGVMGMATFSNDESLVLKEFDSLKEIFTKLVAHSSITNDFKIISMGMSNDYELAIQKGSNMVRIGSKIFGARKN